MLKHELSPHRPSYPKVDTSLDCEVFSPLSERRNPLLCESGFGTDLDPSKRNLDILERSRPVVKAKIPLKRSLSDGIAMTQSKCRNHTTISAETTGIESNPNDPNRATTSRPTIQRACSNSRVERRSRYHDPVITAAALQHELTAQTSKRTLILSHVQTATGDTKLLDPENPSPTPTSSSHPTPDLRKPFTFTSTPPKNHNPNPYAPLKPSLKKETKSTTTPSNELRTDAEIPRILRRVKTVDFDDASKGGLSVSKETTHSGNGAYICPRSIGTLKAKGAGVVTTCTDVHCISNKSTVDPAISIVQIVESGSRCYRVV